MLDGVKRRICRFKSTRRAFDSLNMTTLLWLGGDIRASNDSTAVKR